MGIWRHSELVLPLILMPQSCALVCTSPGVYHQPGTLLWDLLSLSQPDALCSYRIGIRLQKPYARDWLNPEEQQVLKWALITNLSALLSASFWLLCTPKDVDLQLRCWWLSCGFMPSALHFTQYAPEKSNPCPVYLQSPAPNQTKSHSACHKLSPSISKLPVLTS